jgi:NO-binding membrane sensor protein with MHYT domain/signal transduction histidine kinase
VTELNSSFNPIIVVLSILVAIYVSYIVVGLCLRIAASQRKAALAWTIGGSISMAIGIWAMHFIGMLAFKLAIPIYYDIRLTALSIVPAVIAAAIALFMIRLRGQLIKFSIAAVLMGLGISAMHYTGMAAIHMSPSINYDPVMVSLSIVIAIAASGSALFLLSYQITHNQLNHSFKLLSAVIMGVAVAGMHYVGMFAASFPMDGMSNSGGGISLDRNVLLVIVTLVSVFVLFITQLSTIIAKKISENSFYEAVFNAQANIGEGLLVVENGKFILTNQIVLELFPHADKTLRQLPDLEASFADTEYSAFSEWLADHSETSDTVIKQEFKLKDSRGVRTLDIALTSFIYLDKIRQLFVFNDITDQKRAEESIKKLNESLERRVEERTQELKQVNVDLNHSMTTLKDTQSELVHSQKMASLGSLVAGISHEINTPLGIGVTSASNIGEEVNSLLEIFQNGTMKKSDLEEFLHHTSEASSILMQNLKRASDLIASFKQVAVDQSSDSIRTINLHSYLNEAILSMKPKLKKTRITVVNSIPENINTFTHPGALYQVFTNFIQNSLIHGYSEQEEGEIRISGTLERERIKLVYRDTGTGISENIAHKIFDPFFTTRMGTGGSGLGLSIVYNLVKTTLQGNIVVVNNGQVGAHFEMEMPLVTEEIDHVG